MMLLTSHYFENTIPGNFSECKTWCTVILGMFKTTPPPHPLLFSSDSLSSKVTMF